MLKKEEIDAYNRDGFLNVKDLFTDEETEQLATDMIRIIEQWGQETIGWKGPWRNR